MGAIIVALLWGSVASGDVFRLVDLGANVIPHVINDREEIWATTPQGEAIISPEGTRALPPGMAVRGLGEDGWAVGSIGGQAVAAYDAQTIEALPSLPGNGTSMATARTGAGFAVGVSQGQPVAWWRGTVSALSTLPGWREVTPAALNGWWLPCGSGLAPDGTRRAVTWALDGTMIALPSPDGLTDVRCVAINTRGEKYGTESGHRVIGFQQAVRWDNANRLIELPLIAEEPGNATQLYDANEDELAVGWSETPYPFGQHWAAVAWFEGAIYDLQAIASWEGWVEGAQGWEILYATWVNDSLQVVGWGYTRDGRHGWLWTPTEPVHAQVAARGGGG